MKRRVAFMVAIAMIGTALCGCNRGSTLDFSDPQIVQRVEAKKEKPDLELLAKIALPKNPTKQQARDYINAIVLVSKNQQNYQAADPQVTMLAAVGHDHIDELILAMRGNDYTQTHTITAIKMLVSDGDKAMIINSLYDHPKLVEVVMARGWVADAQEVLIRKLRESPGYLPTEWIAAVASLNNPSTYGDLTNFFMNGSNKRITYRFISRLPGIDLTQAAPIAWEKTRKDNYEIGGVTEAALSVGYLPALDFVVESLDAVQQAYEYNPRALMYQYTAQQGTNEELKKWHAANRSNLAFDAQLKRFVVVKATKKQSRAAR